MSDLYRWVNAEEGGPWVDTEDMRQELIEDDVLVPVEPVGTLTVDRYSDARSDVIYGEYGYGIVAPHLPPGKYLIVEADYE